MRKDSRKLQFLNALTFILRLPLTIARLIWYDRRVISIFGYSNLVNPLLEHFIEDAVYSRRNLVDSINIA